MTSKITLNYLALFFIIPFSGFYITKLPLSPIYFLLIVGFYFASLIALIHKRITFDKIVFFASFFLMYLILSQLAFFQPNISAFINFIFSIIVFIISYFIMNKTSSLVIINLSEKLIYFSLPLLIYEMYYRITNPVFFVDLAEKGREDLEFYYFKINSIMYQDSNFVGIFILSLFFFLLYIKQHTKKNYYFSLTLLFLLILGTISRASIFSLILFAFFYKYRSFFYMYRKTIFLTLVVVIITIFPFLMEYRTIDDSFSTKFGIFDRTIEYFSNTTILNQLFGVGFGNAVEVLDIGAHNFFVTYLVESGLIGLFLLIVLWSYILYKSRLKAGIVMFPFLLNGMSLASGAIPYLYVIFAIILVLESRKKIAK